MIAVIEIHGQKLKVDLSQPLDISIPLRASKKNVNAFFAKPPRFVPVRSGNFIGSVKKGSPVNFMNIFFNPHGNGTHTECVGHISPDHESVNQALKEFFFLTELITVEPEMEPGEDRIITLDQVKEKLPKLEGEAVVIRTRPNFPEKINAQYSGKNPPYLHHKAMKYLVEKGVKHLLIDLPSVDREEDGGKLLAHKTFWNYPDAPRQDCTITEMVYVPDEISDGQFLLNLQIASFENDATPSKPVLYEILE